MKNDHINTRGNVIKPQKYCILPTSVRDTATIIIPKHTPTIDKDFLLRKMKIACISLQNRPCNLCVEELSVANNRNTHPSITLKHYLLHDRTWQSSDLDIYYLLI